MTDLADGFDFTAATNAAIDAAEAPEVVEAETPPEVADDRARNEKGQFVAADQEPEAAEAEAAPDLNVELETLRKRLADKDEFISRQGNELGDLRKAVEERFETLSQQVGQPAFNQDLIDADPASATRLAFEQGNQQALAVAYNAWKDEDPASAGAWAAYTAAQAEMRQREEAYEQKLAALEARITPVQEASQAQHTEQRVREISSKYGADEISAFIQSSALTDLASEFPWAQAAMTEDPVGTIESLFLVHRGRTADTHSRTAQEVARETAEQAEQATQDAYVASASTATATTAEPKTEADLIREGMIARITHKESVWRDGWTHG